MANTKLRPHRPSNYRIAVCNFQRFSGRSSVSAYEFTGRLPYSLYLEIGLDYHKM